MKATRLVSLLLAMLLAATMLLTACGTKQAGEEKPKVDGPQSTIVNITQEPPQMNTILTTDNTSLTVIRHVFEGLTSLDKDNNPVPGVAEKWDISDDKTVYTFHLRKDSKWSDGTGVTAKDFSFAFERLLNKDVAAEYAYIAYPIKNAAKYNAGEGTFEDVGIKVKDDYTLEITLERPTPYFLGLMSFGVFMPVNEAFYNKQVEGDKVLYGTEADKMIYNGPWTIKEWAHEDKLVLEKNSNYWNSKDINLDEITMLMVKDGNTALNMLLGDEIDMINLRGDQLESTKNEGYEIQQYGDGATAYFEFNLKDDIMKNNNIRKALTYGIDRAGFVKNVLKNNSLAALSFTAPEVKGLEKPTFKEEVGDILKDNNSEEAKKLLAKGMEELGLKEMPKIQMITDDTDVAKRDAAAYQEYWKKNLGLDVEVQSMPFKSRLARMTDKDFQIVVALWGPDYNDPMTFLDMFETGNGNNHTSYTDAKYDELLNNIRVEADNKKRFELLKETEKKLMEDLPIGPIYFRVRDYVTKPYLVGVVRNAFQDINLRWAYIDNSKK